MVGAGQQPHQVGHHQADETDHAGHRHRHADPGGGEQDQPPLEGLHLDAEVACLPFTQQQGVEGVGIAQEQNEQGHQGQQRQRHVHRLARRQRPHLPQAQVAQHLIVGEIGEQADHGAGQRGDGHPGQQHDGDRGAPFPGAEQIDQGGGQRPAEKGEQGQQADAEQALPLLTEGGQQHDGQRRTERRPAGDPDDAGVGQGVAKQPLHHGAAEAENPSHRDAEQGTWQADLLHDQQLVGLNPAPLAGEQGAQALAKGEGHGAGGQRPDQQQRQCAAGEAQQPGQWQTHHEPSLIHLAIWLACCSEVRLSPPCRA